MTTAAEAIALAACDDLRRHSAAQVHTIIRLEATVLRLNQLVAARDEKIAELHTQLSRAYAENDELRAGVTDASQLGY